MLVCLPLREQTLRGVANELGGADARLRRLCSEEGYISVLLLDDDAAMLALGNRTSRPVRIPNELRLKVRSGAKVVAFLEGTDVIDWTLCG